MVRRSISKAALLATLCWLLGLCCPGTALAEDAGDWPTKAWETSAPEQQGMDSKALADLVRFGASEKMDSLLVTRHGRIVAEAYYAPFRSGHKHRINSATKAVTGTLIAIALRDGLLDSLDRRVLEFFPDRAIANLDDNKQAMTIRHLLNMTSGLDWKERLDDTVPVTFLAMEQSPDWQQFILDQPMAQPPGMAFEYNSGNSHLLSAIINRLTGRSALDYAKAQLFGPLGITDVFWRRDPQGVSAGGAGLYLQPRDMAKIGYLYLRNGTWDGRQIVPPAWIDAVNHASVDMRLAGSALCQSVLGAARQACLYGGRLSQAAHCGDARPRHRRGRDRHATLLFRQADRGDHRRGEIQRAAAGERGGARDPRSQHRRRRDGTAVAGGARARDGDTGFRQGLRALRPTSSICARRR